MKIIALEGLDKSGKHTQAKLLAERLREDGYRVVQSEFHRYDTPTGALIMKWLRQEWDVDQKTIELIMAADKQAQQQWFDSIEESTDVLILDRYIGSQFAYGISANKMADRSLRYGEINDWLASLLRYIRQPDKTILIDIPPAVSMARKGKHNNGENDRYESDLALLTAVREQYFRFLEDQSSYRQAFVSGQESIEEIHRSIYLEVKRMLPSI
jgi:dTMP kinase